jgi:hypothetical protein
VRRDVVVSDARVERARRINSQERVEGAGRDPVGFVNSILEEPPNDGVCSAGWVCSGPMRSADAPVGWIGCA